MITTANLRQMLQIIGFAETERNIFTKQYHHFNFAALQVNFNTQKIIYPEAQGMKVWDKTSSGNFEHPENFVVLECVTRLLDKGYRPEHIELEKEWKMGHTAKSGKADIVVYDENKENVLLIIECKTAGGEYKKELGNLKADGGQLFSYWQQEGSTKWLALYCADFKDGAVKYENTIVNCTDDANILKMAQKDRAFLTYKNARTVQELHEAWTETYLQTTYDDLIFSDKTQAYQIGLRPLTKGDLQDFKPDDKIVNRFEEILRHNNVSDKENAFNRLIALFICKLVDEIKKNDWDEVEFQYKVGTDTYESLQDRLQRLHKTGMKEFMQEEINYVDDNYAEQLFATYNASKRKKAIEDLRNTIRILKYYTNNDFTFKDVHNEELFYQNGKVLVEVVQLFEKYRIVYATKHQFLGDLFENLLAKGFKQNEGQFFTPMPITRFIWDCLPLDKVLHTDDGYRVPKVIDYACGAGHFLTEAVEAVNAYMHQKGNTEQVKENLWVEKNIFGVEKDYRLARVAKVSLYMNGAGKGQIFFGDGLEQYPDKGITNGTFDILVANPPYSVDAFKAHLKLKNNKFEIWNYISNNGNEIETLFVERIAQLLRPQGVAAVLVPPSILTDSQGSNTAAREQLLKNFYVRAIVELGNKTFSATTTITEILFLEKYNEPPKRKEQVMDSVEAISANEVSGDWEDRKIFDGYLQRIGVSESDYTAFVQKSLSLDELQQIPYFAEYVAKFNASTELAQLKNKKYFKDMSAKDKAARIKELLYQQIIDIEKEKLYYFALIYNQNTVIITAPKGTDEQKQFLGYDWSTRRGKEGIQIQKAGGLLYDNENRAADYTLASVVRYSYNGIQTKISENEKYYIYARLQDMIDFSRPIFTKAISLTPKKQIIIQSKYPLVRIDSLLVSINGAQTKIAKEQIQSTGTIPVITQESGNFISGYTDNVTPITDIPLIVFGDHSCTYKYVDFNFVRGADGTQLIKTNESVNLKYLYNYLLTAEIENQGKYERHFKYLKSTQIPLPPLDIQQQIVNECATVDEEYNSSRMSVEDYRKKIAQVFENLQVIGGGKSLKLSQLCKYTTERTNIIETATYITTDNMLQNCEGVKEYTGTTDIPSAIAYQEGDILVSNIRPYLQKIWYADRTGSCSPDVLVFRKTSNEIESKYLYYAMKRPHFFDFIMNQAGVKGVKMPRGNKEATMDYEIVVPSLSDQQGIIAEVEQYEAEITKAQAVMATCPARKKAILDKYLN